MKEKVLVGIVMKMFRQFDYLLSIDEVKDRMDMVDRKSVGVYEKWSEPYQILVEDEFRRYVFGKRLTELSCDSL